MRPAIYPRLIRPALQPARMMRPFASLGRNYSNASWVRARTRSIWPLGGTRARRRKAGGVGLTNAGGFPKLPRQVFEVFIDVLRLTEDAGHDAEERVLKYCNFGESHLR